MRPWRAAVLGVVGLAGGLSIAAGLAGCGNDGEPTGYTDELRREFVSACSAGADAELCGCYYDRLAQEVPFERFQQIDARLRADPTAIPDDIAEIALDCAASSG
jgi:hypothetical protein